MQTLHNLIYSLNGWTYHIETDVLTLYKLIGLYHELQSLNTVVFLNTPFVFSQCIQYFVRYFQYSFALIPKSTTREKKTIFHPMVLMQWAIHVIAKSKMERLLMAIFNRLGVFGQKVNLLITCLNVFPISFIQIYFLCRSILWKKIYCTVRFLMSVISIQLI